MLYKKIAEKSSDLIFRRRIHCDNKILKFHTHSGNYIIFVRFKCHLLDRDTSMNGKDFVKKPHRDGFLYHDNSIGIEFHN